MFIVGALIQVVALAMILRAAALATGLRAGPGDTATALALVGAVIVTATTMHLVYARPNYVIA